MHSQKPRPPPETPHRRAVGARLHRLEFRRQPPGLAVQPHRKFRQPRLGPGALAKNRLNAHPAGLVLVPALAGQPVERRARQPGRLLQSGGGGGAQPGDVLFPVFGTRHRRSSSLRFALS